MLNRRQLMKTSAAALAAGALPRRARADVARRDLRFIFVQVFGGWDPTRVFAPVFDNSGVDMEPNAELATLGDLSWVHHADRPSVTSFLELHQNRTLFVNGLVVPSVNHRICLKLAMSGSNIEAAPDWPTAIAAAVESDTLGLPHVIIGGYGLPGQLSASAVRVGENGQVKNLLSGELLQWSDLPTSGAPSGFEGALDAAVLDVTRARADTSPYPRAQQLYGAYASALARSDTMKGLRDAVAWDTDGSFESQVDLAVDLLSIGMSRCVTVAFARPTWDSHQDNDDKQSDNFEDPFAALGYLMDRDGRRAGGQRPTLADRDRRGGHLGDGAHPQLNSGYGKDHWQHTSVMLVGPASPGSGGRAYRQLVLRPAPRPGLR
ncbi:MAG: hypothetical protein H6741_33965 [Alphaproteobacteria bacterium]|nr:hypothetical protein [Alphaproteobacteria bacterium]